MANYRLNYWIESVSCSLEENDITVSAETLEKIAKDMMNSAECQGQAFGHDAIPNPRNSEMEELKRKYEARIKELEARDLVFRESVANRRGVRSENVYIEHGSVMYDKS
jgi:hypothetical protein